MRPIRINKLIHNLNKTLLLSRPFFFSNKFKFSVIINKINKSFDNEIFDFQKRYIVYSIKSFLPYLISQIRWYIDTFFWLKARVSYYVNNWIYTTNHKRIAVNYFWFVILSGIVGMVLATIIRLEFAYPGVGVLAGDSIQYLSLASAHGVIMVFFMIMPLLFGAFANFLLPTQLGVHDVAFPRLNSAAFWFLPGGLLMLCQLVCIDRRYQRMNCFNIREVESLLKRKFFVDLINTHDHKLLLDKTAIGLRYKAGNEHSTLSNLNFFYNYGTETSIKNRKNFYQSIVEAPLDTTLIFTDSSFFFKLVNYFSFNHVFFFFNNFFLSFFNNPSLSYSSTYKSFINFNYRIFSFIFNTISGVFYFFKNIFVGIYSTVAFFFHFIFLIKNTVFYFYFLMKNAFSDLKFFLLSLPNCFFFAYENIFKNSESLTLLFRYYFRFIIDIYTAIDEAIVFAINNPKEAQQILFTLFRIRALEIFFVRDFKYFGFFIDNNTNRLYIDTNFKDNNVFWNFITVVKISINNWIYFFSERQLRFRWNRVVVSIVENYPTYENYKEGIYSLRTLKRDSLINAYSNSFFFEFFSVVYCILNLPFYLVNGFTYVFVEFFHGLPINEIVAGSFSWFYNSLLNKNIQLTELSWLEFFSYFPTVFGACLTLADTYCAVVFRIYDVLEYLLYNNYFYFKIKHFNTYIYPFFSFNTSVDFIYILFRNFIFSFVTILKNIFGYVFETRTFLVFSTAFEENFSYYSTIKNNLILHYSDTMLVHSLKYLAQNYLHLDLSEYLKYQNHESSDTSRHLRFTNPVFKYDYKSGDYFPKLYKEVYSFLIPSILDLTSGLRISPWFFSLNFNEILENTFFNFQSDTSKLKKIDSVETRPFKLNKISHTDSFYNFFFSLYNSENFSSLNTKWISTPTLNTKFNKLFLTSSLQQRIYNNWRQLKFTREAWRCKMLASRHQRTLFRRYMSEDGVFWSIERNAKDLIPGWAMITPFSSRTRYTAVGKTDIGLMGVLLVLNSSIISGANFLVTYRYLSTLNNRKMRDARAFFTEAVMVASWMMILANPMLVIGIVMLISDRHWQTSFFDYSGGGDTVLFQHMFWFFGHPEVYIIIIPTFGFTNTMISYYLKKRVSARASLLYSLYTIAFLGFFVWGHHMYMVGLSHTTRMLFSTLTVMISVPAATKIMHWCVTTANSAFTMELPLLFTFTFIFFFVSGGISGMCVAHTGMDVLFHDTFYVIGHFHVMLASGAMFACFGAFYFYFPAIFGVKYSRIYAYLHYTYYLIGQLMTVIPMFWLGYAGMPRRVLDYPAAFGGWHSVISAGHMLNVAGLMAFFIMIFDSLRQARAATRNTFGIVRYNTRLNFYLYEISRLTYIQQKALFFFKFVRPSSLKLNSFNYINFEPYESILFSYVLLKK